MSVTHHFANELAKLAFALAPQGTTVPKIPTFNTKPSAQSGAGFKVPAPLKTPSSLNMGLKNRGMASIGSGGKGRGIGFGAQTSRVPTISGGLGNTRGGGGTATGLV